MSDIAAGIVTFEPEGRVVSLCAALLQQGCTVLIHDNGSTRGLQELAECERLGATVVRAEVNSGVAGGLQALLERARDIAEWLLTFDQDSEVPSGFVSALRSSAATKDAQVAIVAPIVIETATGMAIQGRPDASAWYRTSRVITSGALCRIDAVVEVGGFRAGLFIDYVDFDLCLRLLRGGYAIAIEPSATLRHSIGAQSRHRLLGILPVTTSNHSPDRQYYKYRNYLVLLQDGTLGADPRSAVLDGAALLWGPIKILILERHKRAKLLAIGDGVIAGLRGRKGARGSA